MRIVVAEDDALLREGIVRILADAGYEVVGQAADADELRRKVRAHKPEVLVTDVHMPPGDGDDGLAAAVEMRREMPDLAVLVLSQYIAVPYLMELVADDPSGVGYQLKRRVSKPDEFIAAVDRIAKGGSVVDPEVVAAMMGRVRTEDPLAELTDRQREVLALMAEGLSNRGIARQLVISEQTVQKHIAAILAALGLGENEDEHRRVKAVIRYLSND
jgi:DNA-binding NarL/FixJ family response regulator